MAPTGMDAIIASITDVVVPLVTSIFTVITGNPLLTAFVAISLLGAGIGVFVKLRDSVT
jgi:hypothetical protein